MPAQVRLSGGPSFLSAARDFWMETPREGQKGLGVCFEAKSICQFILPSADWLLVPKVSAFFCSLNNRGEFSLRKMTGLT